MVKVLKNEIKIGQKKYEVTGVVIKIQNTTEFEPVILMIFYTDHLYFWRALYLR